MLSDMSTVAQWIQQLQPALSRDPQSVGIHMRRVLFPGLTPQHGEGFLRFQGVEPIYRAGLPPEALSVVLWLGKVSESAGF